MSPARPGPGPRHPSLSPYTQAGPAARHELELLVPQLRLGSAGGAFAPQSRCPNLKACRAAGPGGGSRRRAARLSASGQCHGGATRSRSAGASDWQPPLAVTIWKVASWYIPLSTVIYHRSNDMYKDGREVISKMFSISKQSQTATAVASAQSQVRGSRDWPGQRAWVQGCGVRPAFRLGLFPSAAT